MSYTNGATLTKTFGELLNSHNDPSIKMIDSEETTDNPEDCTPEPLGCTQAQIDAQNDSIASIFDQMAALEIDSIDFPVVLHYVITCDGTPIYILDEFLDNLPGPYEIADGIVINGPDETFEVVVNLYGNLFGMEFTHEPNGNIEYMKWQVGDHAPQFYKMKYDAINRMTEAQYGEIVGFPSGPAEGFYYNFNNNYRVDVSYDAIGNIGTIKRWGFVPSGGCFQKELIDDLSLNYVPGSPRLQDVKDEASIYYDYGFKPKTPNTAYPTIMTQTAT